MKLNYRAILGNWSPFRLRKRIAELEQQRNSHYLGLMSECGKLKEENERLKSENRDLNIIVDAMIQNRVEVRFCRDTGSHCSFRTRIVKKRDG